MQGRSLKVRGGEAGCQTGTGTWRGDDGFALTGLKWLFCVSMVRLLKERICGETLALVFAPLAAVLCELCG